MTSFLSNPPKYRPEPASRVGRITSSNPHNKNPTQKSQRPAPLTRRPTPASASTVRLSKSSSGTGLPSLATRRKERSEEEKFDMATGFLPFCAMCEKQIMTPHNSVLYCSQSCQRQDSRKPLSASSISLSPAPTPPSSPVLSRSIVPPQEPTKLPPSTSPTTVAATATTTSTTTPRIPDHTHDVTSDLDPSEWNPSIARHSGFLDHHDPAIEGFGYFSTHHRACSIPHNKHNRNSSVASLNGAVPSLSSSPSASPSPSPSPSPTLTHATATTAAQEMMKSHNKRDPPSKHYRPLPPLHKPSLSTGSSRKRSVELVMPQAAVPMIA